MEHFFQAIPIAFLALFPLVNPVGAIPLFCTLTSNATNEHRKKMVFKIAINVIIVLIVFLFVGKLLLDFFGISLSVLKIAGGLIVAHSAWEMVTSKNKLTDDEEGELDSKEDISFTPMAMPMLSGPGSIGIVIGLTSPVYVSSLPYYLGFSAGIVLLGLTVYIILFASLKLFKIMGKTGIGVMNRIMGFFILAMAVEIIYEGIKALKF